jgi:hypothetical protein
MMTPDEALAEMQRYDDEKFFLGRMGYLREKGQELQAKLREVSPGNLAATTNIAVCEFLDVMLVTLIDLRMRHEAFRETTTPRVVKLEEAAKATKP